MNMFAMGHGLYSAVKLGKKSERSCNLLTIDYHTQ